jgi:hypothetical protein
MNNLKLLNQLNELNKTRADEQLYKQSITKVQCNYCKRTFKIKINTDLARQATIFERLYNKYLYINRNSCFSCRKLLEAKLDTMYDQIIKVNDYEKNKLLYQYKLILDDLKTGSKLNKLIYSN